LVFPFVGVNKVFTGFLSRVGSGTGRAGAARCGGLVGRDRDWHVAMGRVGMARVVALVRLGWGRDGLLQWGGSAGRGVACCGGKARRVQVGRVVASCSG
tara:strand:+ start:3070 stop:3366 length:297 start_codon:yes stop_codon:yes gene_type:complete